MKSITIPKGVWSASPTPFKENMELDIPSIRRMVEHHLRLGVDGLFLAGTCGEGPYLRNSDITTLVKETVDAARGRLPISAQVTDNSAARILDNIKRVADAGADIAVIAPPHYRNNNNAENLKAMYIEAIDGSKLPIGIYDRGNFGNISVPEEVLRDIYRNEKVVIVKDSSADPVHKEIALQARNEREELVLFNGDEFDCINYLNAGYDGLLLGGGIFNGYMAKTIMKKFQQGDTAGADKIESLMVDIMYRVFGGKSKTCWLSGQKRLLVELGIFSSWKNYYRYPLTQQCEEDIKKVCREYKDWLLP